MGNRCCSDIWGVDAPSSRDSVPPPAVDVSSTGASTANNAVESLLEDIEHGETKIPTFDWRFRSGFGSVPIGSLGATRIAAALSRGHSVQILELQNQGIRDSGMTDLARAIGSDKIVTSLNLSKNGLTDAGATVLAEALCKNNTLKKLVVEDNQFGSAGILELSKMLVLNKVLQHIDVSVGTQQRLDDSSVVALSNVLQQGNLKHLRISGSCSGFSPSALASMIDPLDTNNSLEELALVSCIVMPHNAVADTDFVVMVTAMRSISRAVARPRSVLHTLQLQLPLGDSAAKALMSGIAKSTTLKTLILSKCGLGDTGIACVAQALKENASVTKLDLSSQLDVQPSIKNIKLTPQGMLELAGALRVNRTLTDLNIGEMPMSNELAEAFIEAIHGGNTSITIIRHGVIDSDSIATRLANALVTNETSMRKPVAPDAVTPGSSAKLLEPARPSGKTSSRLSAPGAPSQGSSLLSLVQNSRKPAHEDDEDMVEMEF